MESIASTKHRILLADDDNLLLKLLSTLLSPRFEIIASITRGEDVLEAVHNLKPDVLVMDLGMPGVSAIEIALSLKKLVSSAKIVFLASLGDAELVRAVMTSGVSGFVFKGDIFRDLPLAISEALAGRTFVSPANF